MVDDVSRSRRGGKKDGAARTHSGTRRPTAGCAGVVRVAPDHRVHADIGVGLSLNECGRGAVGRSEGDPVGRCDSAAGRGAVWRDGAAAGRGGPVATLAPDVHIHAPDRACPARRGHPGGGDRIAQDPGIDGGGECDGDRRGARARGVAGAARGREVLGVALVADGEGVNARGNLVAGNGAHVVRVDDADGPGAGGGHVDRAGGSRTRGCSGLDDLGAHDDRFSRIRSLLDRRENGGGSFVHMRVVRSARGAGVSTVAGDRCANS